MMAFGIGVALALAVCAATRLAGLDRDRALYPTMLIVIAAYYVLFAAMAGADGALRVETAAALGFAGLAVLGFRTNLWIVAAALAAHGLFDLSHSHVIDNPGVPAWWPAFCLSFDVAAGAALAWLIGSGRIAARASSVAAR